MGASKPHSVPLPPGVRVLVRDWLSANNVLLAARGGNVLIDSGYVRDIGATFALLTASGADDEGLALVANTHCHSDHMGGNARLAERYGCRIAIPEGEAPLIERWDERALLLDYAGQRADRFVPDAVLRPGERLAWGDLVWHALAAPGHDMGALVFHNPDHGILVSGDALWENGFGFVMPPAIDPAALPAARATLDLIASLDVKIVIPGHGAPFTEVGAALERAYRRLAQWETAPERLPFYALKVMLAFNLLEHEAMAVADLPGHVARVGFFREFNEEFVRIAPEALAQRLVHDLVRGGAAMIDRGMLRPTATVAQ